MNKFLIQWSSAIVLAMFLSVAGRLLFGYWPSGYEIFLLTLIVTGWVWNAGRNE